VRSTRSDDWAVMAALKRFGHGPRVLTRGELIEFARTRLDKRRWFWFATLTFRRRNFPFRRADLAFRLWIRDLSLDPCDKSDEPFYWCRLVDVDARPAELSFMVFAGGGGADSKYPAMALWSEIVDGAAEIDYAVCCGRPSDYSALKCPYGHSFEVSEGNPGDE
jgi:hypothetical protein